MARASADPVAGPRRLIGRPLPWFALIGVILLVGACAKRLERTLVPPEAAATLDGASPFLKAHRADGGVWVLSEWQIDSTRSAVTGNGELLDARRERVRGGSFDIPLDSVALFETNRVERSMANTALLVVTGITVTVAGYCAINPKACFGSCPTFYAPGPDGEMVLQAEGFSASVAPALEATDVDMLLHSRPSTRDYSLRVTNEALETHVIRRADLLAVRRPRDGRAFLTEDGRFIAADAVIPPSGCHHGEEDCLAEVASADGVERWSRADSTDLATREVIELEFVSRPDGELGLVVVSRQTLMTTFLIYQALAYMGTEAGRWMASLEAGGDAARARAGAMGRQLGGIEVLVQDATGRWTVQGAAGETGPIAVDTRIVPLAPPPHGDGVSSGRPFRVRLRLTQGMWRIDQVALARMGEEVEPLRVRPVAVRRGGTDDAAALESLLDEDAALVTLPGDAYQIDYRLPERPGDYDYFLEARGYYLEWMRREWLAEENPLRAAQLILDPAQALRNLAPAFKEIEPEIEHLFWSSRYAPAY